jgi:hypothetical protein
VKTTTDKLLNQLNQLNGLSYPMVGYSYFADVAGFGDNRKSVHTVINENGGVVRSVLNGKTPRERCNKIREAIAKIKGA